MWFGLRAIRVCIHGVQKETLKTIRTYRFWDSSVIYSNENSMHALVVLKPTNLSNCIFRLDTVYEGYGSSSERLGSKCFPVHIHYNTSLLYRTHRSYIIMFYTIRVKKLKKRFDAILLCLYLHWSCIPARGSNENKYFCFGWRVDNFVCKTLDVMEIHDCGRVLLFRNVKSKLIHISRFWQKILLS